MTSQISALIAAERLPADYGEIVDQWWRPLALRIADWQKAANRPLVVGVNGAQGSGKSTLCQFLEHALLPELGLGAVTVSLDDLYLTKAERDHLAHTVHPLLATRGVPGTHDAALGQSVLDDLRAGRATQFPQFSKALDDRLPSHRSRRVDAKADVILFEGWCIGATPEDPADLAAAINILESERDPAGAWRCYVNDQLAGPYAAWFGRIDHLVMLKAPSFESVRRNRLIQEHKLRAAAPDAPGTMNDAQVGEFIMHYERLTRHMIHNAGPRADLCFDLDESQRIVKLTRHHSPDHPRS